MGNGLKASAIGVLFIGFILLTSCGRYEITPDGKGGAYKVDKLTGRTFHSYRGRDFQEVESGDNAQQSPTSDQAPSPSASPYTSASKHIGPTTSPTLTPRIDPQEQERKNIEESIRAAQSTLKIRGTLQYSSSWSSQKYSNSIYLVNCKYVRTKETTKLKLVDGADGFPKFVPEVKHINKVIWWEVDFSSSSYMGPSVERISGNDYLEKKYGVTR